MTEFLRRIHIWVGLFNLTVLIVFAAAGIHITLLPAPAARARPAEAVREVAYTVPPGFTDKQVADDVHARLRLPLTARIPQWALERDARNHLVLTFFGPNGNHRVTVVEEDHRLQIAHARSSVGEFLSMMHGTTFVGVAPDLRLRLWALYVDLSIFSLLFMAGSGTFLWLASRPRLWWAWGSFGLGTGLFAFLWWATL